MQTLGLIAGKGLYPQLILDGALKAGVKRVIVAAFEGETNAYVRDHAHVLKVLKVGQLGKLINFFHSEGVDQVIMAGQITPTKLFDLRPDLKALLILARLKARNAETIFGAVANELEKKGMKVLPATTYIEDSLAEKGWIAGPKPSKKTLQDVEFGWGIAKQVACLDIGQTIVVKNGTVLAVEGFEGTNEAIRRGGTLGNKSSTVIKVSKPGQDFRFDVPVVGAETLKVASQSGISAIVCEAKKTLLLDRTEIRALAENYQITLMAEE